MTLLVFVTSGCHNNEECRWFFQQERTYWAHDRNQYLLPGIQRKDRDWCNWRTEMECNFENTIASLPQFWDWLENKRNKNDKVSREMWKVVKIEVEKVRVVKVEGRREKEEVRKKKEEKEQKKRRKNKKGWWRWKR